MGSNYLQTITVGVPTPNNQIKKIPHRSVHWPAFSLIPETVRLMAKTNQHQGAYLFPLVTNVLNYTNEITFPANTRDHQALATPPLPCTQNRAQSYNTVSACMVCWLLGPHNTSLGNTVSPWLSTWVQERTLPKCHLGVLYKTIAPRQP